MGAPVQAVGVSVQSTQLTAERDRAVAALDEATKAAAAAQQDAARYGGRSSAPPNLPQAIRSQPRACVAATLSVRPCKQLDGTYGWAVGVVRMLHLQLGQLFGRQRQTC